MDSIELAVVFLVNAVTAKPIEKSTFKIRVQLVICGGLTRGDSERPRLTLLGYGIAE
jgi:hypothetical protein